MKGKVELEGLIWGVAIGRVLLFFVVVFLLLCFLQSTTLDIDGLQAQTDASCSGFLYQEEGAPTLLFLMVASEHSASEESQSESPNCSGF